MDTTATEVEWLPSGRGSALEPLDAAVELLHARLSELLPLYVLAILPLAAAMLLVIDAVAAHDRAALTLACAILTATIVWRWCGLAVLQRRVQTHLRGQPPEPLRSRWLAIFLSRLLGALAVTWGALLLLPALLGFFFAGLITPALLDRRGRAWPIVRQVLAWLAAAAPRLLRIGCTLTLAMLLAALAWGGLQATLVHVILPSLLGIETTGLLLTMQGSAWWMSSGLVLFLLLDFYWAVASVTVFYEIQSKRLGSDLRWRLAQLKETES